MPSVGFAEQGWLCSAFFVSSDGYIATASHCVGTHMRVYYTKDGIRKALPAHAIAIDKVHDVAVLKIDDTNLPYFSFENKYVIGDPITLWGWPNVDVYGMSLKHYAGKITGDDGRILVYSFVAHGMSGGVAAEMDGLAIGVIIAGYFDGVDKGYTTDGIIARIEFVQILLIEHGIITAPNFNKNPASKMVFLVGTDE